MLAAVCLLLLLHPFQRVHTAAPGDRYEVRVRYFHPMRFDTEAGRYVLELPTVVPKVGQAGVGTGVWKAAVVELGGDAYA